jgi:hypothetical protein
VAEPICLGFRCLERLYILNQPEPQKPNRELLTDFFVPLMRDPSPLLLLAKHYSPQASDVAPLPPLLLTDVTEDYHDPPVVFPLVF